MSEHTEGQGDLQSRKPCIACKELIASDATICPYCRSPQSSKEWKGLNPLLKWVGGVTAAISLLLGLSQVTGLFQNFRQRHKEVSQLVRAGDAQRDRGDYPAAFESYANALKLDQMNREAQQKEAQAAMLWLENIHAEGGHTFTEFANKLLPVLDRASTTSKGSRAADLVSHVGWANFLKYREGMREGVTIDENFRRALTLDPNNVYAHAMWGFWILWEDGKLEDANQHFSAALAAGRVRPYVRGLQLSALTNIDRPDTEAELIRAANEMRKNNEPIPPRDRDRMLWNYDRELENHVELVRLLSVLPAADAQATYFWLNTASGDRQWNRWPGAFIGANVKEIVGSQAEALSLYRTLRKELQGSSSILIGPVDEAIKRLSHSR